MKSMKWGAAALAVAAAVSTASPAFAADESDSPGSVFVQCDGRVGHVSDGARLMRVLLVTATAGISETAMSRDNADKRAKGAAGVAACDAAIASERDAYRRVQLGFAKALHLAEDKKWVEAAAAARAAPALSTKNDWALTKSATSTARYLEALFLVRAGKIGCAEAAAWDGSNVAGLDVMTMQRMIKFAKLSRTLSPEKKAALLRSARYYPVSVVEAANALAVAGDYDAAITAIQGLSATIDAMVDKPVPATGVHAAIATYSAMKGDAANAHKELQLAHQGLDEMRAKGDPASDPTTFERAETWVAFAEAATSNADGNAAEAAERLGARGTWVSIAPELVARVVGDVAAKLPENQRKGVVSKGADAVWDEAVKAQVAAMSNTDNDDKLWGVTALFEQDEAYRRLASRAATGSSAKPKWLLKPNKKNPAKFEILATLNPAAGWEDGEALLYHAALIARARGKQGFIVLPTRKELDVLGLKFLNAGEEGIPAPSMIMADEVIAQLSPHFPVTVN